VADPGRIGPLRLESDDSVPAGRFGRLAAWRWAWVGGGLVLVAACSAVWSPLRSDEVPSGANPGSPQGPAALPAPSSAFLRGDVDAPRTADAVVPGTPFMRTDSDSAEGRLLAAYAALGEGRGREAFEMAAALVRDHPNFALAQLLHADLLAARAGWPAAFGVDAQASADTRDPRRLGLRMEAQRRIDAMRERPAAGQVPAEFVRLAPSIKHAVAVDATRSRLYLFAHGPDGLTLVRDFYVSLGKQGVDKYVEGDRRTPLGVYWITAALPKSQLDARFGHGALRFNYPNAADKMQGRTGSGLFLHGVPSEVMNHEPWATDGCVAMSNADVEQLLRTLDVSATPVVITRAIRWVAPSTVRQAAAEFDPAWQAWSRARREAATEESTRWYVPGAPEVRRWRPDPDERHQLSLLSWQAEDAPMMIVTSHAAAQAGSSPVSYRQYWTRRDNQWRIAFEGSVAPASDATRRTLPATASAEDGDAAPASVATVTAPERQARSEPRAPKRRDAAQRRPGASALTPGRASQDPPGT
jgi:L,D-transpeptidase YnhG